MALVSKDPARAWNAIYSLLVEGADKKARDKIDSALFQKPLGVKRAGGDRLDRELEAGALAYLNSLPPADTAIESEGD